MASHPLRVLSLCSGYGGLDLAVRLVFSSAVTVCYVEREIPCARILAARMEDGSLDPAPIWDDVSTFDGTRWAGCVDLIVAGFPCQPHSLAGKREGTADARWPVWDDIIRIARECSARAIFLENVPGLLTSSDGESLRRIDRDLRFIGFSSRIGGGRIDDIGGPFIGSRVFILAQANGYRLPRLERQRPAQGHQRQPGAFVLPEYGRMWASNTRPEPCIHRVVDGSAPRLDVHIKNRIRALGNGVVPLQAATALQQLIAKEKTPCDF